MKIRKIRPMYAMSLDWHLTMSLQENEFAEVSDKFREQLIERGMPPREATLKAPIMLDGIDRALQGEYDFKRIRNELYAEQCSRNAGRPLTPPAAS